MGRVNVMAYPGDDQPYIAGWFDPTQAEEFDEGKRWADGTNVSLHTGSKFHHEVLYRTRGGRWVLHTWSAWQGRPEKYRFVEPDDAKQWLLLAEHDEAVEKYFGKLAQEEGPSVGGRPAIEGDPIQFKPGAALLERIDAFAARERMSRAEALRTLIARALDSPER